MLLLQTTYMAMLPKRDLRGRWHPKEHTLHYSTKQNSLELLAGERGQVPFRNITGGLIITSAHSDLYTMMPLTEFLLRVTLTPSMVHLTIYSKRSLIFTPILSNGMR